MVHTGLHDQWHRPSDDADTINLEGASTTARLLFAMVVQAANQPKRFVFRSESRVESPADQEQSGEPGAATSAAVGDRLENAKTVSVRAST